MHASKAFWALSVTGKNYRVREIRELSELTVLVARSWREQAIHPT